MTQLSLFYPPTIDLDGMVDERNQVEYMGQATYSHDNHYQCLAKVDGALCVVEVKVSPIHR